MGMRLLFSILSFTIFCSKAFAEGNDHFMGSYEQARYIWCGKDNNQTCDVAYFGHKLTADTLVKITKTADGYLQLSFESPNQNSLVVNLKDSKVQWLAEDGSVQEKKIVRNIYTGYDLIDFLVYPSGKSQLDKEPESAFWLLTDWGTGDFTLSIENPISTERYSVRWRKVSPTP